MQPLNLVADVIQIVGSGKTPGTLDWEDILTLPLYILNQPELILRYFYLDYEYINLAERLSAMSQVLLGYEQFRPSVFRNISMNKQQFSFDQLQILFETFFDNPELSFVSMRAMAMQMGLSERQVRNWFYNRRSDLKEGNLKIPAEIIRAIGHAKIERFLESQFE